MERSMWKYLKFISPQAPRGHWLSRNILLSEDEFVYWSKVIIAIKMITFQRGSRKAFSTALTSHMERPALVLNFKFIKWLYFCWWIENLRSSSKWRHWLLSNLLIKLDDSLLQQLWKIIVLIHWLFYQEKNIEMIERI